MTSLANTWEQSYLILRRGHRGNCIASLASNLYDPTRCTVIRAGRQRVNRSIATHRMDTSLSQLINALLILKPSKRQHSKATRWRNTVKAWRSHLSNCLGYNRTLTTSATWSCLATKACFLSRIAHPTMTKTRNCQAPAAAAKDLPSLAPVRQPAPQNNAGKNNEHKAWVNPFPFVRALVG